MPLNPAYAHFFGGKVKDVDGYQVAFVPYPSNPTIGNNSTTLNFSILKENNNINNVYVAVIVSEKKSGTTVAQFPYSFYEFSDVTIPYVFANATDYQVTLRARIAGDEKFQANPLTADFDITAIDPSRIMPFDQLMLFYATPAAALVAGVAVYLHLRSSRMEKTN